MSTPSLNRDAATIQELIACRASLQPEADLLISPETGRTVTYRQLQRQSELLWAQLRERGLQRGDKVALLMDNGLFSAQLFLGLMYGGFVVVPLNVRAGAAQLSFTLNHSDAKVVFVEHQYFALIKEAMIGISTSIGLVPVDVDGQIEERDIAACLPELPVPEPEEVALLMYTSGSTGQPKAAVHSHRTILEGARNSVLSHQLTAADRSLLVLPLYHINAECVTLVPTLVAGGSVVVPHHFSVSHFWDWLDQYRCTWSAIVPTIISQLLDWKDPQAGRRQACFERVRFLRSSSAPLSPALHREFLDKFKIRLIQAMGCSEGGNVFSNPQFPGENKIGSPGLAWGFETRILNREGTEVAPGSPGELLIRGRALMQGYYKDPTATAAVVDSDGWLHTGDLAYQDSDGYFFVVGRSKELIIKGGVNIAPKQIDEALESHPSVREAAAVGVPDRYVGEDVIAFVVLRADMHCDEIELLRFCESRLGSFKTPTRIHFVQDLPKGPSGKIQRLRLVEEAQRPDFARSASLATRRTTDSNPPADPLRDASLTGNALEQMISGIWAGLLHQPQIEEHANFFALGGHSLLAIQCLSRIREKIPVVLSLSDFFEHATVAELAGVARERLKEPPRSADPASLAPPAEATPVPLRDPTRPAPLSPAQERIWFFGQLLPGVPLYNESEAVRLEGDLNVPVLEQAINLVIARHEILRSTIHVEDGQPMMLAHAHWRLRLKELDLSALPPAQQTAEVARLLIEEPRLPYALDVEPGIRVTVARLGPRAHVFILMMHHLVCDWSSTGIFWREMAAAYSALVRGQAVLLSALPRQYADYALAEREHLANANLSADLAYWEQQLQGAPRLLELPADRPRPAVNTHRGARQRFRIDSTLAQALRDCSRREKISLFTVFAAAFDVLLHRYTGQEDILLGIPLADRDRLELQSVIGFLLHTHVLRTRLSGDISFRELLARVQKGVLDLYTHRAPPFDRVVNAVHPERNLSHSPLFQVMINWRDREQQPSFIGLDNLTVESLLAESRTAKFDLMLQLTDNGDAVWAEIEYNTDLFDDWRMARLFGHYQTLLAAVSADPTTPLAALPLLSADERQQILVEWNRTAQPVPEGVCLHQMVEAQADRVPEATALVFENQSLTYRELNQRANQLARYLQRLKIGPGTFAGICVSRSLEMVVGMLAVLKTGAAYVPLDPHYPKDRLEFMVSDSTMGVLLTEEALATLVAGPGTPLVRLDSDWPEIAREAVANVPSRSARPDPAYVIYTSGSTGRPKGVVIEHRNVVAFVAWAARVFTADELAGVLFSTSICFDLSVFELFVTLTQGGTVILVRNILELPGLKPAKPVTLIDTVPSAMTELVRLQGIPPSVITVNLAGEALTQSLVDEIYQHSSARKVYNLYGPTETTTYSTFALCARGGTANIGRPIANTSIYLLDRCLNPVPVGVPGELCIGGAGLAAGYLHRPELTAEKFIPNPFATQPGERLYRTGDLARYLPDGNIEYLGRLDHQVKLRGFRIELGEIETVLAAHPAVGKVALSVREDRPGERRLVAYVVPRNGGVTAAELRDSVNGKLPDYMMPGAFVFLDRLPQTPNGKLDRRALPPPAPVAANGHSLRPAGPVETALAQIWCEVLGLRQVGAHDDFFELGGNSLLGVRMVARVERDLRQRIPLAALFKAPTVAALAKWLSNPEGSRQKVYLLSRHANPDAPRLFVLHFAFMARSLAEHLGDACQVYYLESPIAEEYESWQKTGASSASLPKLAEACIEQLQRVQPHGPYHFAGFCFGGNLGFEMARQLAAKGEEVALLAMLSSHYHAGMKRRRNPRLKHWPYHLRQLSTHGWPYLSLKIRDRKNKLVPVPPAAPGNHSGAAPTWDTTENAILQSDFTRALLGRYTASPVPVNVLLFRGISDPPPLKWEYDPNYGWKDLVAGNLLLEDVFCSHSGLVQDAQISEIAGRLRRHFAKSAAGVPASSGG